MSTFSGQLVDFTLRAIPTSRVSTLENYLTVEGQFPISLTASPATATDGGASDVSVASQDFDGVFQPGFGGDLFERIIVLPRVKAIGFVLSSTQFPVEVWNTFHDSAKALNSITITGSGGITITNPFTLPKSIGAKGSIIFQAVIPGAGDVNILLDVVFGFTGISGTDMAVSGSRILVFSVAPDWENGIEESIEYLTNVLTAYDDSEQRRALRTQPRRGLKFTALALDARSAAGMEALVWGWQHLPYGVPFWQDSQPLRTAIEAGAFVLDVDTTLRLFAPGGILVLWKDEFTFEALTISDLDDDSITLSAPTQFAWDAGAGTRVVPVFLGRLANSIQLQRLWSQGDSLDVEFSGEALQVAPTPTELLTQFKGFDVLEVAPNWVDGLNRTYKRSIVVMDSLTGTITVDDKGGTPIVSHDMPWWVDTHTGATILRAFLVARLGMFKPFWVPTFDQDLVLSTDGISGNSVLTIQAINYTRFFFPDLSRRYLALLDRTGGANRYVTVTGSTDNGDGTESLTLSAALTADVPVDTTMISFLTFSRLQNDKNSIVWSSTEFAEATISIQEVPREIPT